MVIIVSTSVGLFLSTRTFLSIHVRITDGARINHVLRGDLEALGIDLAVLCGTVMLKVILHVGISLRVLLVIKTLLQVINFTCASLIFSPVVSNQLIESQITWSCFDASTTVSSFNRIFLSRCSTVVLNFGTFTIFGITSA